MVGGAIITVHCARHCDGHKAFARLLMLFQLPIYASG